MTIVRAGENAELSAGGGSSGLTTAAKKHPAKKHAEAKQAGKKAAKKHAAKKHAAKKHAAKKHAAKGALHSISEARDRVDDNHAELGMAFHHLQRAGAVISLLEAESGGDLRALLEHGIDLYRQAAGEKRKSLKNVQCASGLLRAAEHLGMAGLYSARREYRVEVAAPSLVEVQHHLDTLASRLDGVKTGKGKEGHRLLEMARELLWRSVESEDDRHLRFELVMAADGICSALEAGI